MNLLSDASRLRMRSVLERAFADQGYAVAWGAASDGRAVTLPEDLPDELWAIAHEERPAYPEAFRSTVQGVAAPPLPAEIRDAIWNRLAAHLTEQGRQVDERDHPALRQAGRIILPLRLITDLWEAGNASS